jgi:hypothetical protein
MLLQLAGVTGESSDAKLKDHIDLTSWSWGMLSPTDVSTGHAAARAKIEDFKIVKRADRSSVPSQERRRRERQTDRAQGGRRRPVAVLRD